MNVTFSSGEPFDAVTTADDRGGSETNEQAVLDDAGDRLERGRKSIWIGNAAKRSVEDVMAAVGDKGPFAGEPQLDSAGEAEPRRRDLDRSSRGPETKGHDLDR